MERLKKNIDGWKKIPAQVAAQYEPDVAEIARLRAEVERLREIIKEAVYEVTHLSPEELDGSHWARISAEWLQKARAALNPPTGASP